MLDANGHEILDDTPIARPVRISTRPGSLEELKSLLKIVSREAELNGQETFEESEDFDVGDDPEPFSRWEIPTDEELNGFAEQLRAEKQARSAVVVPGTPPPGVPGNPPGNATSVPSTPIPSTSTP